MARLKALLALMVLISSTGLPLIASAPAFAGDSSNPEMTDASGDSVGNVQSKDLISGWLTNETETTVDLVLDLAALQPFTPYSEWQNLPVIYYEFFFDVNTPQGTGSYSAKATIPVHGPLAAFSTFELLQVNYSSSGSVVAETSINTLNGAYQVPSHTISMTVDKSLVGAPGRSDTISGIWARVQSASQRNAGDAITADVMMSHLAPGKEFVLTGGVTFYAITVSSNVTSTNATPDDPARFVITITSSPSSDKSANVSLRNSSALPANWTMTADRPVYVVAPGESVSGTVTITPGGNTSNITRRVTVGGQFRDDQDQLRSTDNTVTLTINVPLAAGPGGGGGGGGATKADSSWVGIAIGVGAVGALIVAGLVVYMWYLPRRRGSAARASYAKIAQLKVGKSPRSGAIPGRPGAPGARPGLSPSPGALRPGMPRPGPRGPAPGPVPRQPPTGAQRPVPRRR
jgi:hypothetical protein